MDLAFAPEDLAFREEVGSMVKADVARIMADYAALLPHLAAALSLD